MGGRQVFRKGGIGMDDFKEDFSLGCIGIIIGALAAYITYFYM